MTVFIIVSFLIGIVPFLFFVAWLYDKVNAVKLKWKVWFLLWRVGRSIKDEGAKKILIDMRKQWSESSTDPWEN